MPLRFMAAAVLAGLLSPSAHAAESYDNCTGFINSVPTTLTTQGVWCMNKDLATGITVGNAITIANNNITLDCNGFKLGGLSAGLATQTVGINAQEQLNATIRHCNVRGFRIGVLAGGSGHVVEDNRIEANRLYGIRINGDQSVARRNLILDTGGASGTPENTEFVGLWVANDTDAIDNTINGVYTGDTVLGYIYGLVGEGGGTLAGNRIHLKDTDAALDVGIIAAAAGGARAVIRGNDVVFDGAPGAGGASGIWCSGSVVARDNTIINFATPLYLCPVSVGNVSSGEVAPP